MLQQINRNGRGKYDVGDVSSEQQNYTYSVLKDKKAINIQKFIYKNFVAITCKTYICEHKKRSLKTLFKGYLFGFNGQEKDNEVYGDGNSYTAEFWQYDPGIGRRWNLDPVPQIHISDYACFANSPILMSDPKGDIWDVGTDKQTQDDVYSMAKNEKNRGYIKIDNSTGRVSLDFGTMSAKQITKTLDNDPGLQLVYDLVNAKDGQGNDLYFYYSTQGPFNFSGFKESGIPAEDLPITFSGKSGTNGIGERDASQSFFFNASITTYGIDLQGKTQPTILPKTGYQGQVAIAPGTPTFEYARKTVVYDAATKTFSDKTETVTSSSRRDFVMHELRENVFRTKVGLPYLEAHKSTNGMYFDFTVLSFIFK